MKAAVIMDMYGCPNRCRHCWLRHDKNANTSVEEFIWLAEQFKSYERDGQPFFEELIFNTWYREPDFPDNYRELWELENRLSTIKVPRYELASVWRMVRDKDYAPWLKELGVEIVQLTLFGTEENTDYFTGRKGAYREHMQAIEILLENGIVPRIQIFPFSTTIDDNSRLHQVMKDIRLEERVNDMGKEFPCFLNTTTLMGAGFDLENIRFRRNDVPKLPKYLIDKTLKYFNAESTEVHWRTEAELLPELLEENNPLNEEPEILAFMVDADFNVYPNIGEIAEWWCLGNIKEDGLEKIIDSFIKRNTPGVKMNFEIPIKYFAEKYGKQDNKRLWSKVDLVKKWHRLEAMNNREAYL